MRKLLLTLLATAIALPAFAFEAPFNTSAISMKKMPLAKQWSLVKAAPEFNSDFDRIVIKNAEGLNEVQKLSYINTVVNQFVKYDVDPNEVWQTPEQTIKSRHGDCEDYAILKMHLLKKLNIDSVLLVVWVKSMKEGHAVLSASVDNKNYILDNRHKDVKLDTELPDYDAVFLFNNVSTYILGTKIN